MPSGLIDEENGMGSWCDRFGDFRQMQVHRFGVAGRQDQSRALSLLRLGDRDTELLVYPLRKIDQPPAHDTVDRRDRAALDHPHNRLALHIIELRGLAWR